MKIDVNIVGASSQEYIIMQKNLNLKLLFKYTKIEHVTTNCSVLWSPLNYRKKKTCDVD
jgi:hypothetical protein